jgi:hypothetical protein
MGKKLWPLLCCVLIAVQACQPRPTLGPPKDSAGKSAPLYANATRLKVGETDQQALVTDLFGADSLLYSSVTDVSWTRDAGSKVQDSLDRLLPDSNWRVETDWTSLGSAQTLSIWRNGDVRLQVLIIDNLDSSTLSDLRKRYGFSGPEAGSTLIVSHVWDISKPLPSATPTDTPVPSATPVPTQTPLPTQTPVPTSTPTIPPDTAPGTSLKPGDVWSQAGMEMRLKSPSFVSNCSSYPTLVGFELTIINHSGSDLVTGISGLDFAVSDDQGQSYAEVWWDKGSSTEYCYGHRLESLQIDAMTAGQRIDLAFRVYGTRSDRASKYIFTVLKAGRITNAVWVIDIPR